MLSLVDEVGRYCTPHASNGKPLWVSSAESSIVGRHTVPRRERAPAGSSGLAIRTLCAMQTFQQHVKRNSDATTELSRTGGFDARSSLSSPQAILLFGG